jgi:sporulation protein YlmC with PRC-barrel domain
MTRFTLLASVAALAAAPALAQESGNDTGMTDNEYLSGTVGNAELENMLRASNIIGGDVFAVDVADEWSEQEWSELDFVERRDTDWEDIGNITDVVLSPDGQRVGLIVSHGGFLDIGDDTVLLTMEDIRRVGTVGEIDGNYNYVTRMTEDQIEDLQEVEENWW